MKLPVRVSGVKMSKCGENLVAYRAPIVRAPSSGDVPPRRNTFTFHRRQIGITCNKQPKIARNLYDSQI